MSIEKIFSKDQLALYTKINEKVIHEESELKQAFEIDYSSDMSTNVYYFYPMMFFNSEISLPEDKLIEFILAGVMYYEFIIAFDRKLDGQSSCDIGTLFYHSMMAQRSIEILSRLFDDKSKLYFECMHKYTREYIEAVCLEKNSPEYYKDPELRIKVMKGKSAVAKCFSAGIAILSDNVDEIAVMDEFQDNFNLAFQLFDDFKDIKEDIKSNKKTWVNAECFDSEENKIYEHLFSSGKLLEIFKQVVFYCNKSISLAGKYPAWIRNVRCFLGKVNHLFEDLCGRHVGMIDINQQRDIRICYEKMIEFFKKSYINDRFTESEHYMNFPHEDGYCSKVEQVGNIFIKTELINILCSCNADKEFFEGARAQWAEELWKYKTKYFECGWSYFPELLELAPDVDDLAEIMRLYKNDESAREYMIECINFVINNCIKKDGSVDTWMISKDNLSENEIIAKREANLRWQIRQDIEVAANFFYSLSFYKEYIPEYENICSKGYEYILSKKSENGLWKSTWYTGDLYCTYMCMNFFKSLGSKTADLKDMAKAVSDCFDESGEYTYSDNLNDLSLALIIIMGTTDFNEDKGKVKNIIIKAKEYLPAVIDKSGFCCAMPFISLGTIKYYGKVNGKNVEYSYENVFESQLLTSSLVLKCLSELVKY